VDVLSSLDAAFLDAEDADEHVSMAICSVAIFDGSPPVHDELVSALSARLALVPRYRQRVRRFPLDLVRPTWADDPDFDINFHVRRTALPAPGDDGQLDQLVGRVMSQRLDRDRPLWETWVVEGLDDDKWALISKVHHCMVDGVAGTELYHLILSPSPTVERLPTETPVTPPPAPATSAPLHVVRLVAAAGRHPRQLLARVESTGRGLFSLTRVLVPAAPSTLLGRIGRQRRYTSATVCLSDVKRIRRRFDVTVNDVAVSAATAGFRALLLTRGELPSAHMVRSLIPINVRVPGAESALANRVSCMFVDLPVHIGDPVKRLEMTHMLLAAAKARHEADAGEALVTWSDRQPFSLVSAALRAAFRLPQQSIVTVTTNVPGPAVPLYLLGRRLTRLLPVVPIADRVRVGVAVLSYCDELAFGITGDYDTAGDIDVMTTAIRTDIENLRSKV
jgi:diacylglycerol O-acyltransferase